MRVPTLILATALAAAAAAEEAAPRPLHLAEAVRLSAASAPVGIARFDAAIARAGLDAQRATLEPQVSATAGASRSAPYFQQGSDPGRLSPANILDARLRLGQALIDLDAWNRACAADRRFAAAEAAGMLALEDAASGAGEAYLGLAQAEALVQVRTADLGLAGELQTLARAQVEAGIAEAIAGTRAEIRVAEARAALAVAQGSEQAATITLARALGLDPATRLSAADPLSENLGASTAPGDAAAAGEAARRGRPELRVSIENLAAIEADRRAARGARLPKLDAFADGGRTGPRVGDTVSTWEIGVQLTIPILDRSRYDEAAARYRVDQERLRYADLGLSVDAEVRQALVALATNRALLVASLDSRRLAEQEVEQARARFASGVAGNLELVDAQRALTGAREQVLSAQLQAALAQVRLARAVGAATTIH